MKTKSLLFFLLTLFTTHMIGQNQEQYNKELLKITSLTTNLKNDSLIKTSNMFTDRGMDVIFKEIKQQVAGVNAKEGKSKGLSGTIDDKGMNFNGTLSKNENKLFGLTVSASSKENFTDIFSSNKLRNIYSIGGNYKFYFKGSTKYKNEEKSDLLKQLNSVINNNSLTLEEKIKQTDNIQKEAPVQKSITWLNFNLKYNNNPLQLLDINQSDYTKTYYNEYFSTDISINYLRKSKGNFNLYFSPTLSLSDSRNFKSSNIKNVNITNPITLGTTSAEEITSISYFDKSENRIFTTSIDFPFVLFFPKQKLGLDLAFKAGINDPDENNISARFGAYIPFYQTDKKESIIIEPILKFNNLFSSSSNNFIEDNLSFGFNLSVTIPDFMN